MELGKSMTGDVLVAISGMRGPAFLPSHPPAIIINVFYTLTGDVRTAILDQTFRVQLI